MKIVKRFLYLIPLIIIILVICNYPKLNIIAGYTSKNMASSVFLAERSEAEINEIDNNFPLIKLAKTKVDYNQKRLLLLFLD